MKEITDTKQVQIVRITYGFGIVLLIGLVFLRLSSIILFKYFIDPDFSEGIKYVFWIGLGYVFQGMYGMVTNFIYYFEKTRFLSYLAIMNIAFNLFFNYIFISRFGAMGAAYATSLSFFVFFVVTFIISYRLFPLPWFSRSILDFRKYPAF